MEKSIQTNDRQKSTAIAMSMFFFFSTFILCNGAGLKIFASIVCFIHDLLLGDVMDHFSVENLVLCEAIYAFHLICLFSFKKNIPVFY